MSGGKKFNVWIVYADLFSNLSVFLFISAFGMFAALGSGALTPRPGLLPHSSGDTACEKLPFNAGDVFKGGRYKPVSAKELSTARCAHYFELRSYRYRKEGTDIAKFVVPLGHNRYGGLSEGTYAAELCAPIWGAALHVPSWNVTVLGATSLASANSCKPTRRMRKAVPHMAINIILSRSKSVDVSTDNVRACLKGGHKYYCTAVRACVGDVPSSLSYCDAVQEINDDDIDNDTPKECLTNIGRIRAQSFSQYCEGFVDSGRFDKRLTEAVGEDFVPVNLKSKWMDRVHTNGVPVIAATKRASLRDGEIILEVHPKGH